MYYFASDTHLGLEAGERSAAERERMFVRWLDDIAPDAEAVFLVGDIFDFWYEYKRVVPKGFVRLLAKLAELTGQGIPVHFFAGNHDMWAYRYLHDECGVTLHAGAYEIMELSGRKVLVGHGDTLGPRGFSGRLLSRIFRSPALRTCFSRLVHPDTALRFGQWWSGSNRRSRPVRHTFRGSDEPIVRFAAEMLRSRPDIDLFVCGHIHCAEIFPLGETSRIAFLGEWIEHPVYGTLDERGEFALHTYPKNI